MPAENPRNGSPYAKVGQVTMTAATATLILAAISAGSRQAISIRNIDTTNTIYVGFDNTVSATTGYPLYPGEAIEWKYNQACWGFPSAGTPKVAYLTEEGV